MKTEEKIRAEIAARETLAARIIARIEDAFAGVVLGNGVSLHETWGLDDYEDEAALAADCANDEKVDWRKIGPESIYKICPSFLDSEGMRFYLPATLRTDLQVRHQYSISMFYCLTHLDERGRSLFSVLNAPQRQAVRTYLQFLRDDPYCEHLKADIDRALTDFWTATEAYSNPAEREG